MKELIIRIWEELIGRGSGPLQFRLVLQPLVASIIAICAARKDARERRPPLLRAFVQSPARRRQLLSEAWKDIGRLFLVGIGLDVIYQLLEFHGLRPLESLIVATALAVVPYVVVRGLTNRIMTWLCREGPATNKK